MQLPSLLGHVQEILGSILKSEKPPDSLIDSFFRSRKYLGSHDRRFIAETTYGTLRHLRRAKFVLDEALKPSQVSVGADDSLLLLIASYLIHIESRPEVTFKVVGAKLHSSTLKDSLPEILQRLVSTNHLPAAHDVERIGLQYSYADWMIERLIKEFGVQETELLCASLNEQAPITLRVNTLKTSVEECQRVLKSEGVETARTKFSPVGLYVSKRINIFSFKAFREGFFEVQDEGSQLLALLIDPKPTAKVLDACAGAGGKTLALAAIMKNRGEIFATDVNEVRLNELRKRTRRAGLANVRAKTVEEVSDLTQEYAGFFDLVFIDAPCSGLGTIRRNPGLKWSVSEDTVKEISEKQRHILDSSVSLVKEGGQLVYATCTMLREENESVVEDFLERHKAFVIVDPIERANKVNLDSAVLGDYIKLSPHRHGTDGFFFAMMEKHQSKL